MRKFLIFTEFRAGSNLFIELINNILKERLRNLMYFDEEQDLNLNYYVYSDKINCRISQISLLSTTHTDLGIIFLSRRDKLKQALSIARLYSLKDRNLRNEKKVSKEEIGDWINFSEDLLEECILTAVWQYAFVKNFVSDLNKDVLPLTYEDDLENPDAWFHTVQKVLDFIGNREYEPKDIKERLNPRYPKNSGHLTDKKYKEFLSNFNKFRIP